MGPLQKDTSASRSSLAAATLAGVLMAFGGGANASGQSGTTAGASVGEKPGESGSRPAASSAVPADAVLPPPISVASAESLGHAASPGSLASGSPGSSGLVEAGKDLGSPDQSLAVDGQYKEIIDRLAAAKVLKAFGLVAVEENGQLLLGGLTKPKATTLLPGRLALSATSESQLQGLEDLTPMSAYKLREMFRLGFSLSLEPSGQGEKLVIRDAKGVDLFRSSGEKGLGELASLVVLTPAAKVAKAAATVPQLLVFSADELAADLEANGAVTRLVKITTIRSGRREAVGVNLSIQVCSPGGVVNGAVALPFGDKSDAHQRIERLLATCGEYQEYLYARHQWMAFLGQVQAEQGMQFQCGVPQPMMFPPVTLSMNNELQAAPVPQAQQQPLRINFSGIDLKSPCVQQWCSDLGIDMNQPRQQIAMQLEQKLPGHITNNGRPVQVWFADAHPGQQPPSIPEVVEAQRQQQMIAAQQQAMQRQQAQAAAAAQSGFGNPAVDAFDGLLRQAAQNNPNSGLPAGGLGAILGAGGK